MNSVNAWICSINRVQRNIDVTLGLNTTITQYLGLVDKDCRGTQEATLEFIPNNVVWTIPVLTKPIKGTDLLDENNRAKDEISFKFILIRLQVWPVRGETYKAPVFKREDLGNRTGYVISINPILSVGTDNTAGYDITG